MRWYENGLTRAEYVDMVTGLLDGDGRKAEHVVEGLLDHLHRDSREVLNSSGL